LKKSGLVRGCGAGFADHLEAGLAGVPGRDAGTGVDGLFPQRDICLKFFNFQP